MSGFIYLWFDTKHKRYYLGSHWGTPDDGYVCSSDNMRHNYRNRPQDFKRRILKTIDTNRQDLFEEEQRWLNMIKPYEISRKYYNMNKVARGFGKWNENVTDEVKQKISNALKGNTNGSYKWTEEQKEKNKASYQYIRTEAQVEATKINQQLGAKASPITKKGWVSEHRFRKHGPHKISEEGRKAMQLAGKRTNAKRWGSNPSL